MNPYLSRIRLSCLPVHIIVFVELLGGMIHSHAATTQKTSRYEAEAATIVGGTIRTWGSGYSGTGAVSLPNSTGDSIQWTVTSDHAGPAKLSLRYALGGSDRPVELKVNGQVVVASLSFPTTAWDVWGTTGFVTVPLNAGNNTVRIATIGSKGPDIDYLGVIETIPLSVEIMTVYAGANLSGTSATVAQTHTVYSGGSIPGGLDNQISSFVLSEGYMAVVADPADGTNPSKVYIAADGPLTVNTLPANLDNAISFIRVVPWIHTQKKGFCGGNDSYRANFDHSWYYDWTKGLQRGQRTTGPEYTSMCWDERYVQINEFLAQDQITHLLSFNEPDGADQANMPDIAAAVALHKELQKTGLRLGSPACREENAVGSTKWLDQFMTEAEAQGVRVDYINVHWYDWGSSPDINTNPNPEDVANRLKAYLSNVYNRYRKPIWITEFNANPARPRSVHDGFLQKIMPYLDDVAYVERYAYYQWPATVGTTMYFVEPTDSSLTTTGQIYSDHQSPASYLTTTVPSEWLSSDIGGAAKGDTLYNGNFTISGSGAGITGAADGCRFVYQPVSGDVTITAKITGQIWRNANTMAGLMIRETLNSDSKQASMVLNWGSGAQFRRRTAAAGTTTTTTVAGIPKYPYWVRLVRSGNTLTGYHSADGITWTQTGTASVTMGAPVYVGMAVTSFSDGSFNDAIFKHVSVTQTLGQSLYIDWTRNTFASAFTSNSTSGNQDGDGLNNLQEFAFGMDPTSPLTPPVAITGGGTGMTAGTPTVMLLPVSGQPDAYHGVFARRKDHAQAGLIYTPQFSADLKRWTTSSAGIAVEAENSAGNSEAVSVPYPASVPVDGGGANAAPRFFRVGVAQQ